MSHLHFWFSKALLRRELNGIWHIDIHRRRETKEAANEFQVPPLKWHQRLFAHFFQKNSHFSFRRNAKKCDESHQILSWKMHFYFVGQDAFCFFGQRQILKFRVIWQNLVTLTCKIEPKNTKLILPHGEISNFLLWKVNEENGRLNESGVRKHSKWGLDQPKRLFEKFHHFRNFGSILPRDLLKSTLYMYW